MKKLFTTLALAILLAGSTAVAQTSFSDSFTLPRTATEKDRDLMAIDHQGNVYVAGLFTQDLFEFGTSEMEGITGGSTYLIKYAPDGSKQWGVAITGAATPTAITTDATGNIYLAGTYADKITINGTSGTPVVYEGMVYTEGDDIGKVITDKNAGYLIKYSPEGIILKSEEFRPEGHPVIMISFTGYTRLFNITQLSIAENKLYVSVKHSSKLTKNGVEINGPHYLADGFMDTDPVAASFIEFNTNLEAQKVIGKLQSKEALNVGTPMMAIDGNKCFVSSTAIGENEFYVAGLKVSDISIPNGATPFDKVVASLFAAIDLNTNSVIKGETFLSTEESGTGSFFHETTSLQIHNNQLMVAGKFKAGLSFNNSKTAQGNTDFFQATLSTSDLSVIDTKVAGTVGEETITASQFVDGGFILYGNAGSANGVKATMNSQSVEAIDANKFFSGAGANTTSSVVITLDKSVSPATFSINASAIPTSVDNTFESKVRVYPNPVVDQLFFSETADVVVFNNIGEEILKANGVNSLNMASLAKGIYFVKVSIEGEVKTVSIVKE